jgi:hypothetical protein
LSAYVLGVHLLIQIIQLCEDLLGGVLSNLSLPLERMYSCTFGFFIELYILKEVLQKELIRIIKYLISRTPKHFLSGIHP